jgi:hypothetical protein
MPRLILSSLRVLNVTPPSLLSSGKGKPLELAPLPNLAIRWPLPPYECFRRHVGMLLITNDYKLR